MADTSRFMTVEEVAQFLRLTTRTVYTMVEVGILPGTKIGGVWRIDREQLEQKLASSRLL